MAEQHDGLPGLTFGLSDSLSAGSVGYARWLARVAGDTELRIVKNERWYTDLSLQSFGHNFALLRSTSPGGEEVLLEHGRGDPPVLPGVAHVRRGADGQVDAIVAARYDEQCDAWLQWLRGLLEPRQDDPGQTRVPVVFWALSPHGPLGRERRIDVRSWQQIASNYSRELSGGLGGLMGAGFAPGAGGQLLVWHGEPGTGKTWALRALAWEWRGWCDMHYVTDPETFFGGEAHYMLEVLLGQEKFEPDDDENPDPRAAGGRWRCLILEDTGELLQADAGEKTGQGLSRLLNVVDGMIGQGLRVLALLTTNEQLRALHPAVSRPGRCAAHIEFDALTPIEAEAWLRDRDHDDAADTVGTQAKTIAQLYELADQHAIRQRADREVGFR